MRCGGCGKRPPKNNSRPQKKTPKESSLKKYAFLHPNQKALLESIEAEENKEQ